MLGSRTNQSNSDDGLPRDEHWIVKRLNTVAWLAVVLVVGSFLLLDVGLQALIDDPSKRILVRTLVIASLCVLLTLTLSRRAIQMVARSVQGERAARNEAEALANLASSVAAGHGIQDTLQTAVSAAAGLFGVDVRCTVALPGQDGVLRSVAWSHAISARFAHFSFRPGQGIIGAAFAEGRLVRVDDVPSRPDHRRDIAQHSNARSMMAAPLVADQRILGVISAVSPMLALFGAQEERVLTAVARHVSVALVAAEAREGTQREAAKKSAIIDQMDDAVLVADQNQGVVECNRAAATLFDVQAEELIGLSGPTVPWRFCGADGVEIVPSSQGPLNRALSGESVRGEYRIHTHSGLERWVWAAATPLRAPDGTLEGAILVLRDMAEWRRAEMALRESEERYRLLVELCPDPILVHRDGQLVYANPATINLAGASTADELIGRSVFDFVHPDFREAMLDRAGGPPEQFEAGGLHESAFVRIDGEVIPIESTTMPITFAGQPAVQVVLRDVTERRRAEAALAHQALHDALTGLPNRVLLLDRLEQALTASELDGSGLSLLLMDLDRFKEVNDTLGHHAGDLLLQQVGSRLHGVLRAADTIARLGGDEFAVILPGIDKEGMVAVVEKLLGRLKAPFSVEGQQVVVGASIGVAVSPEHGHEADALMRRADVAMYVAKRTGTGFSVYQADQDRNSPDRLSLINELRRAVEEGELVLHYQPKIDLRSGALAGVEALVRWEHPIRGLISADQFIPIAEQAGLIDSLSQWVLRAALMQATAWRRIGLEIPVAVNLSMRSLYDEQLPDKIAELLLATRTPASLLVVEITESSLMIDPPRTLAILTHLREMGIRVAIDDFGTGHSSLAYLKRLPVDEVKIDRSFVKDLTTDATDRVIVRATVDLAHSLGLRVVAEGVEDERTSALLVELGCDEAQGFHLGRPLRGHELTHWLCEQPVARAA